jgi:hypothetical protein
MTLALASKPGISGATVLHIPKDWDATWFRNFINNLLKGADVRNAIGANGITVSGNISSPFATISGSGLIKSVVGTANQIAVSTAAGVATVSIAPNTIIPTPASGTALTIGAVSGGFGLLFNGNNGGQIAMTAVGAGGTANSALQLFTDNNLYIDSSSSGTPTGGNINFRGGTGIPLMLELTNPNVSGGFAQFSENSAAFGASYGNISGIGLNNASSSMQTSIDFAKAGVLMGRLRSDFVGNMNHIATGTGAHNVFVGGDSGVGSIGFQVSSSRAITFPGIGTTASAANAFLDSAANNNLLRSTSSIRYKTNVNSLQEADINAVLQMRPVTYTSLCSGDDPTKIHLGFIAEEIAAIDPRLVFYTWNQYQAQDDGLPQPSATAQLVPDGVQYDRLVTLLVGAVQTLAQRVTALEQQTTASVEMPSTASIASTASMPSTPSPQLSVTGDYGLTGTDVYAGPVTPITVLPSI